MEATHKNLVILGVGVALGIVVTKVINLLKKPKKHNKTSILDCVGNTPLLYLEKLSKAVGAEIYAKAQFMNPFGSSKDRAVQWIIREAQQEQQFEKTKAIIEASSGSTAISLTKMAHVLGLKPIIFLPNDLAEQKLNLLQVLGAEIVKVPPALIVDPKHYYNLAASRSKQQNICFSNQFENLANYHAHYNTTGPEILRQTGGNIDCFICSVGTGGTLAGVSRYLKEKKPEVSIVLADPQGSGLHNKVKYGVLYTHEEREGYRKKNPFDSVTEGIGLNRSTLNLEQAMIDDSYRVTDEEALHLSRYLIVNQGLFLGSSSSVNLAAAIKYGRRYPNSTIVTILHDSGSRYMSKFYSKKYLEDHNIFFEQRSSYPPDDLSFIL